MSKAALSIALTLCEEGKLVLKKHVQSLLLENERLRKEQEESVRAATLGLKKEVQLLRQENDGLRREQLQRELRALQRKNDELRLAQELRANGKIRPQGRREGWVVCVRLTEIPRYAVQEAVGQPSPQQTQDPRVHQEEGKGPKGPKLRPPESLAWYCKGGCPPQNGGRAIRHCHRESARTEAATSRSKAACGDSTLMASRSLSPWGARSRSTLFFRTTRRSEIR